MDILRSNQHSLSFFFVLPHSLSLSLSCYLSPWGNCHWARCGTLVSLFSHLCRNGCPGVTWLIRNESHIFTCGYAWLPVNTAAPVHLCIIYVSRMQLWLSPPSVSLHGMSAAICDGRRRICLTDSGKHNGSVYQEQPHSPHKDYEDTGRR